MRAFTILIGADLSFWALARQNPISHASVAQRIEYPRIATGPKDILTHSHGMLVRPGTISAKAMPKITVAIEPFTV